MNDTQLSRDLFEKYPNMATSILETKVGEKADSAISCALSRKVICLVRVRVHIRVHSNFEEGYGIRSNDYSVW